MIPNEMIDASQNFFQFPFSPNFFFRDVVVVLLAMGTCCSTAADHAVGNPNTTSGRQSPEAPEEWLDSLDPVGTAATVNLAQFEASNSAASLLHRSSGTGPESATKRHGRNPFRDPSSSTGSVHSRGSRSVTFIGEDVAAITSGPASASLGGSSS